MTHPRTERIDTKVFADGVMRSITRSPRPTPSRAFLQAVRDRAPRDAAFAVWVAWHLATARSWSVTPTVRVRSLALVIGVVMAMGGGSLVAAKTVQVVTDVAVNGIGAFRLGDDARQDDADGTGTQPGVDEQAADGSDSGVGRADDAGGSAGASGGSRSDRDDAIATGTGDGAKDPGNSDKNVDQHGTDGDKTDGDKTDRGDKTDGDKTDGEHATDGGHTNGGDASDGDAGGSSGSGGSSGDAGDHSSAGDPSHDGGSGDGGDSGSDAGGDSGSGRGGDGSGDEGDGGS